METALRLEPTVLGIPFAKTLTAKKKPIFVTFEGGEGAGKSTQVKLVAELLKKRKFETVMTREPYDPEVRKRLLAESLLPLEELNLFIKDRALHVRRIIKPELRKGKIVLCDRFSDSTVAYQHFGRGLPLDIVRQKDAAARQGLTPDLTILLDIDSATGLARKAAESPTRFKAENLAFHERVRKGFLIIASREPERVVTFNAADPPEKISGKVLVKILKMAAG